MNWLGLEEFIIKWWVLAILPIGKVINSYRIKHRNLEEKVNALEKRVDTMDNKFDKRFDEVCEGLIRNSEDINALTKALYEVKEETSINKTRLEERS